MNVAKLDISEQMLFALLKASLHNTDVDTSIFQDVSDDDWQRCYRLSVIQGVMALAWDGVVKLPPELMPTKMLKLNWGAKVLKYENIYHKYCSTAIELSNYYSQHGIATMFLKGVGLSALYPIPSHREGGDIDIYTYSADKGKKDDVEANTLADTLMQEQGIIVNTEHSKHSNFSYKGIPIENHKHFLNIGFCKSALEIEKLLRENMVPEYTILSTGMLLTPPPLFNTLFIAFHACQHLGNGLSIHHLCDWAIILKHYGLIIPETVKDKGFLGGVYAFTNLCNQYLGTSIEIPVDGSLSTEILNEILHPKYSAQLPTKSKIGVIIYKIKRMLYTHRLKNRVIRISLMQRIGSSIIFHLRHPKVIFS